LYTMIDIELIFTLATEIGNWFAVGFSFDHGG
jgi:hypothetical protein